MELKVKMIPDRKTRIGGEKWANLELPVWIGLLEIQDTEIPR